MSRTLPLLALLACSPDKGDSSAARGDAPDTTTDSETTGTAVGWTYETAATGAHGRYIADVGIAGYGDHNWLVWNDAAYDANDARTVLLTAVGASRTITDFGWRIRTDSSPNPSVVTEAGSASVFVGGLATCDAAWKIPCPADPSDRAFEVLVVDKATGAWTSEPVDTTWPTLDHGRGDLAIRDGQVDACFKARHPDPVADEVTCNHRDAAGTWGAAVTVTGMDEGADDHATVVLRPDQTRIAGYVSTVAGNERRAAVALGSASHRIFYDDGAFRKGEDTSVALDAASRVHAVWVEAEQEGGWKVQYARCDADDGADGCAPAAAWTLTELAQGGDADSPDITTHGTMPIATWALDGRVQIGWICEDGSFTVEDVDPMPGDQTTNRGQPSLRVDAGDDRLHVVYTLADEAGMHVRWAQRPLPACP